MIRKACCAIGAIILVVCCSGQSDYQIENIEIVKRKIIAIADTTKVNSICIASTYYKDGYYAFVELNGKPLPRNPDIRLVGNLHLDSLSAFGSFKGEVYKDHLYLNWTWENDNTGGIYIIEESRDSISFEPIHMGKRIPTLPNLYTAKFYETEASFIGKRFYRVLQFGEDGGWVYSNVISLDRASETD